MQFVLYDFLQSKLYEFNNVAAQTKMQKITQKPLHRRTHIIMSYFVEFVHTFDRFFILLVELSQLRWQGIFV